MANGSQFPYVPRGTSLLPGETAGIPDYLWRGMRLPRPEELPPPAQGVYQRRQVRLVPGGFGAVAAPMGPERQQLPPERTESAIALYRRLLEEGAPDMPELLEGEGPGAYKYGGKTYKSSRAKQLIGTAALAFAGPSMSEQERTAAAESLWYGPYSRAMEQAKTRQAGYTGKIKRAADLVELERQQREDELAELERQQPRYMESGGRIVELPPIGKAGQPRVVVQPPTPPGTQPKIPSISEWPEVIGKNLLPLVDSPLRYRGAIEYLRKSGAPEGLLALIAEPSEEVGKVLENWSVKPDVSITDTDLAIRAAQGDKIAEDALKRLAAQKAPESREQIIQTDEGFMVASPGSRTAVPLRGPSGPVQPKSAKQLSTREQQAAKDKLLKIELARKQLEAIKKRFDELTGLDPKTGVRAGGWAAGPFGSGKLPTEKGRQFDAAVDAMRQTITALTRTPGIGQMSDYETRLFQAQMPTRENYESVTEQQLDQLDNMMNLLESGYEGLLTEGSVASSQPATVGGGTGLVSGTEAGGVNIGGDIGMVRMVGPGGTFDVPAYNVDLFEANGYRRQ